MGLFYELRLRARYIIGPVLGVLAVGYFAFHAIRGERGIIALRQLSLQVELAQLECSKLKSQRKELEHRVSLLHPDSLDPDMLDERARVMLNYGHKDDIVIIPEINVIMTDDKEQGAK
jgi:cell division protein FtsB